MLFWVFDGFGILMCLEWDVVFYLWFGWFWLVLFGWLLLFVNIYLVFLISVNFLVKIWVFVDFMFE